MISNGFNRYKAVEHVVHTPITDIISNKIIIDGIL